MFSIAMDTDIILKTLPKVGQLVNIIARCSSTAGDTFRENSPGRDKQPGRNMLQTSNTK